MPSDYYFGYYFYAPNGRFEPCGMFTIHHIVAAISCLIIVAIALFIVKKHFDISQETNITKILRFSAVALTIFEIIKIAHSLIYGDLHLDAWFPLSYCGLFIFALWIAASAVHKSNVPERLLLLTVALSQVLRF